MDLEFRTTIELGGKTATGFEVPERIVEALGSHKRPPVKVTIRGYTYRSTIAPYGGRFLVPLSAENRAGAGVAAGDEVTVTVELDLEPREVAVPADFRRPSTPCLEPPRSLRRSPTPTGKSTYAPSKRPRHRRHGSAGSRKRSRSSGVGDVS